MKTRIQSRQHVPGQSTSQCFTHVCNGNRRTITRAIRIIVTAIVCFMAFPDTSFAQITLPEVRITATSYKYLNAVDYKGQPQPVKLLQAQAATYNIKESPYYEEDYDNYFISFYIPDGRILAAYDKNGKLLRTAEKYKNVQLPKEVTASVTKRFPNWAISKDVYLVDYYHEKNIANKLYKLVLENGDQRVKVSLNEKGEFK